MANKTSSRSRLVPETGDCRRAFGVVTYAWREPGADLGTKPVLAQRLQQLLQVLGMTTAEEFLADIGAGSTPKIENEAVIKLLMVLVMCSSVVGSEAKDAAPKPPLPVDGSLEFYISIVVCGIAMLGVWELLRWLVQTVCCSRDEATILRSRRLLRIRDQAARALRQELAALTPEESVDGEQGAHGPSSLGTRVCSPNHPDYIGARGSGDPDLAMLGRNDITELKLGGGTTCLDAFLLLLSCQSMVIEFTFVMTASV